MYYTTYTHYYHAMHTYVFSQAKHMIMLKDSVMEEILKFLDHCEGDVRQCIMIPFEPISCYTCLILLSLAHGRTVLSVVEQPLEQEPLHAGKNTVAYEARLLKALFIRTRK